jgi:hypothetical protein
MTADTFRSAYLHDIARTFQTCKSLGDRAVAQVSDEDLQRLVDPEANSIAVVLECQAMRCRGETATENRFAKSARQGSRKEHRKRAVFSERHRISTELDRSPGLHDRSKLLSGH